MNLSRFRYLVIAIGSLIVGSVGAISESFLIRQIDSMLPDSNEVSLFSRPGTITILSTNGKIIQKLGPATRQKLSSGNIPIVIKKAFIAAEDRRFYNHKGVDLWGISRAFISNISQGAVTEGGSTITQQLARIIFLSQDKTFTRKLKEAALAFKLERQLTKAEILEEYLNNVYLGSGAYGISDASWVYFSKTPELLTLEEAALIAGLPPAPSVYTPLINPELAIERQTIVLERMYKEGFISKNEFLKAINKSLRLRPATPKYFNSIAPFFSTWVSQQLPLLLSQEQIELGGLQIRTSLNLEWQLEARKIIREFSPEETEGAMVAIQPNTGLVRVLIGGKDFSKNQFNRATQALRSPGSTFKLFPYAAAIKAGITPEDLLIDTPRCWYGYCPKNFGDRYLGKVSVNDAFKNSLNTIAVELLDKVGFQEVISIANDFDLGKESPLGNYYPLAIGAFEETLLNMTAAYAGVANRGIFMTPIPFEEITGPGNKLLWSLKRNRAEGFQALTQNVADTLNWMLQQVVSDGSGKAASLKDRAVAGKTGTSEGSRDLWFIGSIPQLTTGIWFGYDNNAKTQSSSGEAAWAWKQFMLRIKNDFQIIPFPPRPSFTNPD